MTEPVAACYVPPTPPSEDAARFRAEVDRFRRGEVSAAEFRVFRVPMGIYEQREDGTYMIRVRFPAGVIRPGNLRALAAASRNRGNGVLHVTTRQEVQIHRVRLDDVHPALEDLARAGLSTRGGGGNTVRNITACVDAGVCAREAFDVTPWAVALTEFLVADPASLRLPRKFKVAVSGCTRDCAGATVNDAGLVATDRDGERGFAVYVGGGMGAHGRVGDILDPFVRADRAHVAVEAIKRVFDRNGNRRNKHRARLRFLVEGLGLDRFRTLYEEELDRLRRESLPVPRILEMPEPAAGSAARAVTPPADGFADWRDRRVVPQKQAGRHMVRIPLALGDIPADTAERLADVVEAHGEGGVRGSQRQDLVLRWVRDDELPGLHRALVDCGLAGPRAAPPGNIVACAGASTCRLGICLSRGLAKAIVDRAARDGLDMPPGDGLDIFISGCPNACGRHPVADVGLSGTARRVHGRPAPHYAIHLGGRLGDGATAFAVACDTIPARAVPAFLVEFLRAFRGSAQYPEFGAFLEAGGREVAARIAERLRDVPPIEDDPSWYFDWGADAPFSLAGRGPGECGAGVFDLIDVDLAAASDAVRDGGLVQATVHAARALLVTQGLEARDEVDAINLFAGHFVDAGFVDGRFRGLLDAARRCIRSDGGSVPFGASADDVAALVGAVRALYDGMDDSLRFAPAAAPAPAVPAADAPEAAPSLAGPEPDREADLSAVACPLNYVKTKLLLGSMRPGQVLGVVLNAEGCRNVPESVAKDGHSVLSLAPHGQFWKLLVRKKG